MAMDQVLPYIGIGAGSLWVIIGFAGCWRKRMYQEILAALAPLREDIRTAKGLRRLACSGSVLVAFILIVLLLVLATVLYIPLAACARWFGQGTRKRRSARCARGSAEWQILRELGGEAKTKGEVSERTDTADDADPEETNGKNPEMPECSYCYFNKPLPFEPLPEQIFYVESDYDSSLNNCIEVLYDTIRAMFSAKGFEFVYLPETVRQFLSDENVRKYYYPVAEDSLLTEEARRYKEKGRRIPHVDYKAVFGANALPEGSFLFRYMPRGEDGCTDEEETCCFAYCRFQSEEKYGLREELERMMDSLQEAGRPKAKVDVRFRFHRVPKPEEPDFGPDSRNVEAILEDVRRRLQYLRQAGVNESVIRSLFTQERKLSRLRVTADFRILLPDYGMEIAMNPLEKAVYFLFLRHPEGLLFKELVDYREELLRLYMWVGGRSRQAMEKSVDDLLDPTKNSLNEKCSRIKEAFLREFDEHLARHYYIDGCRGEPKKIDLPQELVEWEREIG